MEGNQCCNKIAANFQKQSRNGDEKKYLREFDGQVKNKMSKLAPLFLQIDINSEFLTTNTNLSFFYGKVFEVK